MATEIAHFDQLAALVAADSGTESPVLRGLNLSRILEVTFRLGPECPTLLHRERQLLRAPFFDLEFFFSLSFLRQTRFPV